MGMLLGVGVMWYGVIGFEDIMRLVRIRLVSMGLRIWIRVHCI